MDEPTNPVWYYDGINNVTAMKVPTVIWNNVMARAWRKPRFALIRPTRGAISLWEAANIRRELELPADMKDPTRARKARRTPHSTPTPPARST